MHSTRSIPSRLPRVALAPLLLLPLLGGCSDGADDADPDAAVPSDAPTAPAFDLESASFVVTSSVDGDSELFLVEGRADTAWTRITTSPGLDHDAVWIPGSRSIVFHSARDAAADGELDLYRLDVAAEFADEETLALRDAEALRLTDAPGPDYLPAVDPSGTMLAFISRRAEEGEAATTPGHVYLTTLAEAHTEGAAPARRTEVPIFASLPPQWSPDGREVLFVRRTEAGTEIRALPAVGTGERLIHADSNFNYTPVVSPDGRWLAYTAEDSVAARVVLIRPDGSERREITSEGRLYVEGWVPDGERLIVTRWDADASRTDAMLLPIDGSAGPEPLFTGVDRAASGTALRIR